jgi:hypothetical protein
VGIYRDARKLRETKRRCEKVSMANRVARVSRYGGICALHSGQLSGFVFTSINGFSLIGRDSMTIKSCTALLEALISVNDELVNEKEQILHRQNLETLAKGKESGGN